MAQNSVNGQTLINNAKLGCYGVALLITGVASIFFPACLLAFIPLLAVGLICFIIILVMKSSKKARRLNYTMSLSDSYSKYGAGDWHTCQMIVAIIRDQYQNQGYKVSDCNVINEYGNRYSGNITLNGTPYKMTITADGSGNVNWDFVQ